MAHIIANPSSGLSGNSFGQEGKGLLGGIPALAKSLVSKAREKSERARVLHQLNSMSDRELSDIGISRGDIPGVVDGTYNSIL